MKYLGWLLYPASWSIATKVSVALLSTALIPMSFNAYYNLQHSLENAEKNEYRQLELLATSTASRLDQLIIDVRHVVVQVSSDRNIVGFLEATNLQAKKKFQANLQPILKNVFQSNPDYDAVYLIDRQGLCVASTDPTFLGQNYRFREYFSQAIQGQSYISSILIGKTTGRAGLYLSNPVRSDKGEIVGVAVLKIKEEDIAEIVNKKPHDFHGYAFLIDRQGVIISHPNKSLMYYSLAPLSWQTQKQIQNDQRYRFARVKSLNLPDLATAMVGAKEPGHISYYSTRDRKDQRVGFAPLHVQTWVLGVNKSETFFQAPLNRLIWENSRSLLAIGAIATIIALLLARSITKPIQILTLVAKALERDDFESQALELHERLAKFSKTQDDIGQLVRVFRHMAEEVRIREQKLKLQVMELNIEIDETKKARQVSELTGTEYFKQLQQKAQKLKARTTPNRNTETEYFEQLQHKAQKLKDKVFTVSQ